jgi:hypothetical protein
MEHHASSKAASPRWRGSYKKLDLRRCIGPMDGSILQSPIAGDKFSLS